MEQIDLIGEEQAYENVADKHDAASAVQFSSGQSLASQIVENIRKPRSIKPQYRVFAFEAKMSFSASDCGGG